MKHFNSSHTKLVENYICHCHDKLFLYFELYPDDTCRELLFSNGNFITQNLKSSSGSIAFSFRAHINEYFQNSFVFISVTHEIQIAGYI